MGYATVMVFSKRGWEPRIAKQISAFVNRKRGGRSGRGGEEGFAGGAAIDGGGGRGGGGGGGANWAGQRSRHRRGRVLRC